MTPSRRTATTAGAGAVLALGAALALAATGAALPPGGTADQPGTPPGTLTITTAAVPQKGAVGFCVTNLRVDTSGGPVAQAFMLKFDDFGSSGIGPYTPDAQGNLCATISTDPATYGSGAADKVPADLCDGGKEHWLRLLSGSWAHPDASQRSIAASFAVTGRCGDAPGGAGGGGTTTTPGTGGGDGTGGGGTTTTPGTGTPTAPGTTAAPVTLRSSTLTVAGTRVVVALGGGPSFARGTLLLRTRAKVRVGRSKAARRTLARGRFQLAAGDRLSVRLALTADARSLLRTRATLAATLAASPAGGPAVTKNVTVRRPRRS